MPAKKPQCSRCHKRDARPNKKTCSFCCKQVVESNALRARRIQAKIEQKVIYRDRYVYLDLPTAGRHWAAQMFEVCPPAQRAKLYRQLSAIYHPDVGGDGKVMAEINNAMDSYK